MDKSKFAEAQLRWDWGVGGIEEIAREKKVTMSLLKDIFTMSYCCLHFKLIFDPQILLNWINMPVYNNQAVNLFYSQ